MERDNGYLTENEDENDYFTQESQPKPKRKKRIMYIDEIDGDEEGNEQEEEEEEEKEPKLVKKTKIIIPKKKIKKKCKKNRYYKININKFY